MSLQMPICSQINRSTKASIYSSGKRSSTYALRGNLVNRILAVHKVQRKMAKTERKGAKCGVLDAKPVHKMKCE